MGVIRRPGDNFLDNAARLTTQELTPYLRSWAKVPFLNTHFGGPLRGPQHLAG
jgi:hypothetical protein